MMTRFAMQTIVKFRHPVTRRTFFIGPVKRSSIRCQLAAVACDQRSHVAGQ